MRYVARTGRALAAGFAALAVACTPAAKTSDSLPASDGHLSLSARGTASADGMAEVVIEVRSERAPARSRAPVDLVAVLDVSVSMTRHQTELARSFLGEMLHFLSSTDRFALVAISDEARVEIPLTPASEPAKREWRESIRGIEPAGLTNLGDGIETARALAPDGARILLISDGSPTWGTVNGDELVALAEGALWSVGVGRHQEPLLRGLGRYFHLRDPVELADEIALELFPDQMPVATGLTLTLDPPRNVEVLADDLHEGHRGASFGTPLLFGGDARRFEIEYRLPVDETMDDVGDVTLRYASTRGTTTLRVENVELAPSPPPPLELAEREP